MKIKPIFIHSKAHGWFYNGVTTVTAELVYSKKFKWIQGYLYDYYSGMVICKDSFYTWPIEIAAPKRTPQEVIKLLEGT